LPEQLKILSALLNRLGWQQFASGHRLNTAEHRLGDERLARQPPVKQFVVVVEFVECGTVQGKRDECGFLKAERDGYDGVFALPRIQLLGDDVAFPRSTQALPRHLLTTESPQVGFRTSHEHKDGLPHLPFTPQWPAFFGRLLILVDVAVDARLTQPIGQGQNAILVLMRVVAVADENPRRAHLFRLL
jgi:hypothetical protein